MKPLSFLPRVFTRELHELRAARYLMSNRDFFHFQPFVRANADLHLVSLTPRAES